MQFSRDLSYDNLFNTGSQFPQNSLELSKQRDMTAKWAVLNSSSSHLTEDLRLGRRIGRDLSVNLAMTVCLLQTACLHGPEM